MITVERIDPSGTAHRIAIRGHELVTDFDVAAGGADAGPDPHDLYDSSLGACTALTLLWYAQRHGIVLEDIIVSVARDAHEERQGRYKLTVRIAFTGDLDDVQRAKLLEVAAKCPIHKVMTEVTTEIETIGVDPADLAFRSI